MQRPARCVMTANTITSSLTTRYVAADSSAFPGARNTSSTTRETVRATTYSYRHRARTPLSHTFFFYSHRSPRRGLCFNTELSSCLRPEAIHVGESCAQPGNRTRSCSCNRRGNARPVAITDTNTIGHFTLVVYFAYSSSLPYPGDCRS
jgi:hypothetical protein